MIKDIVFDFGGVLTTIDTERALKRFRDLGLENPEQYINSYCQKGPFFALENGDITADEFCRQLGVLCNREIKFDAFLKCALELNVDYVATGHYCKKDEFVNDKGETIYRILAGDDKNKDQSYFLCQLSQEQLSKALFPIGEIDKPEVRRLAKEAGLPSAEKKDSQGICFVGKVDLPVFLQQKLKSKEGKVVEIFANEKSYINVKKNYKELDIDNQYNL